MLLRCRKKYAGCDRGPGGVQLRVLNASTDSEIDGAFASLTQLHADALLVGDDPFFASRRNQIVALASSHAVPAIYQWRDFAVAGGLVSYGVSLAALYRLSGIEAGKILKGARPVRGFPGRQQCICISVRAKFEHPVA